MMLHIPSNVKDVQAWLQQKLDDLPRQIERLEATAHEYDTLVLASTGKQRQGYIALAASNRWHAENKRKYLALVQAEIARRHGQKEEVLYG